MTSYYYIAFKHFLFP